jgi:hypothetical protein
MQLEKYLLPRFFRYVGYTLIVGWIAAYIFIIFMMGSDFFDVGSVSIEVAMFRVHILSYHLPVIGLILSLISKEKIEDEMSLQLRMQSFLLGLTVVVVISFVLLIYSVIWNPMQIYISRAGLPTALFVIFMVYHFLKWRTSRDE